MKVKCMECNNVFDLKSNVPCKCKCGSIRAKDIKSGKVITTWWLTEGKVRKDRVHDKLNDLFK